jgi:hypothetical protein
MILAVGPRRMRRAGRTSDLRSTMKRILSSAPLILLVSAGAAYAAAPAAAGKAVASCCAALAACCGVSLPCCP